MNAAFVIVMFVLAFAAIIAGEKLAKKAGIKSGKSDKYGDKHGADKKKH